MPNQDSSLEGVDSGCIDDSVINNDLAEDFINTGVEGSKNFNDHKSVEEE